MITILLELFPYEKPILSTFNDWWKHCISATRERDDSTSVSIIDEDEDVKAERQKILGGYIDNAMLYLCNLRKVLSYCILPFASLYVHLYICTRNFLVNMVSAPCRNLMFSCL